MMGRGRGGRENCVAREPGTHLAYSTQGLGTAGNRSAPPDDQPLHGGSRMFF